MAKTATPLQLAKMVEQFQADRQKYVDAIAEIDDSFAALGIKPARRKRRRGPGRSQGIKKTAKKKVKKKVAKKRGKKNAVRTRTVKKSGKNNRRRFSKTADQFVLDLLKGGKTLTSSQINSKWKQAKRGSTADNTLSKLSGERKIKRQNIQGKRGSSYNAA